MLFTRVSSNFLQTTDRTFVNGGYNCLIQPCELLQEKHTIMYRLLSKNGAELTFWYCGPLQGDGQGLR